MQCTLNRVRHEDLHLALAEILDVVIQSPVLELFAFGRAHGLPKPFESQKVVPPQLLRPLLNRNLGGGLLKYLAVSSSRVWSSIVVPGADDTSCWNPIPTWRSCGRDCIENRNAVFVPRAVFRI